MRVGQEHNDNPELTIQPHNSVTGTMVSPKLDLGVSSDIWFVTGSFEAVQKRYSGQSGLDTDDRYYNLMTSYKTERSAWQLGGSIWKNSTLASEQISPNTGLVQVQKAYDTHSISPSWTWAVDELTQLQLGYSFNSVSYVDGQSDGLFDYSSRAVSAQLSNQLNPNDQVFVSSGYSIFNVPATTLEQKTALYQAGFTRTFSETARGTLSVGSRRTSSEQVATVCTVSFGSFCLQTSNETQFSKGSSFTFSGDLEKQYETIRFKISLKRAFEPSGLGDQVETDSEILTLSKALTPILEGNLSVSNYGTKSETGKIANVASHFYSIAPSLHWTWMQEWSADLGYQYMHIKRETDNEPAASNAVNFAIRYAWPKMSVSR